MRVFRTGLVSIALFTQATGARADECRYGDVMAQFQAAGAIREQAFRGLETRPVEQLYGPTGGPCQYRLFGSHDPADPPPIQTFTSRQFFLGGVLYGFPYALFGLSREQAEEDLALIEDRVYLIPAADDWSYEAEDLEDHERTVLVSAFKHTTAFGVLELTVHRGVIEQLPPGRYVSLWTSEYPGNPALQSLHPEDEEWVAFFSAFEDSGVVLLDIVP